MAVKKKIIIIINERGRFACQAYIESATALSDTSSYWFRPSVLGENLHFLPLGYSKLANN